MLSKFDIITALGIPKLCLVNLAHMSLWPAMHGSNQAVQGRSGRHMRSLARLVRLHRSLGCIELRRTPTLCVTNAMPQQLNRHGGGNLDAHALIKIRVAMCRVETGNAEGGRKPMRWALKRVSRRN